MKYKFVLYQHKIHPKVDKIYESWYLLVDNRDRLDTFLKLRSEYLVKEYFKTKENIVKKGHHLTVEQFAMAITIENHRERKSIVDDCAVLDNEFLYPYINIFNKEGNILVGRNFGFRWLDDSFIPIKTIERDEFMFPETVITEKDIKVHRFMRDDGENFGYGKHFYVMVGKHTLDTKYLTEQEALNAGKRFIEVTWKGEL